MADLKISELPVLQPADLEATDDLAVADYSASETRRITVQGAITTALTLVANGAIPGSKLAPDSVTALEIAANAVGASELADNAVDTAAVQDAAITDAKLAPGIDGGKLQNGSVEDAKLAPGINGAKLLDDSVTDAKLANGIHGSKLQDGTVTDSKIAAGLDGGKILPGTITASQLAASAVTATELANNSVDTLAIQDLAVTDDKIAVGINGAKLTSGTIPGAAIAAAGMDRGIDNATGAIGHSNSITSGSRNGITYDAHGHVTGTTALNATDLPVATTTTVGGVSVPAGSGLTVSGTGALTHTSTVTPGTRNGISYSASGHITGTAALAASDLPLATAATAGAAYYPGVDIQVAANGAVTHAASGVTPGTYTRVTVGATGHITAGGALTEADIPGISASKLVSGTLDVARIAAGSITRQKLAAYAIGFIQEGTPPTTGVEPSTLWLQESTGQLRMWNGNSWYPIGFGRLSAENLRYCGTFDAAAGNITGLTQFGVTEGFKIGDPLPAALDRLAGVYFVATTPGSGTAVAVGITFDNGDWILCNGATAGWVRVDTLNGGGGGGGGASLLDDLLDVTLTPPSDLQVLSFDSAAGVWINRNASAIAPVGSVFGRTGDVVAAEGDYSLTLLGDVTLTTASTGEVLRFDGTQWANAAPSALGTALATATTLMARDAAGSTAVNTITATVYNIDALPALP